MPAILEEGIEEKQELQEKHERILKRFFEAGVTPDFAQNSEDRKALEGWLNQCVMKLNEIERIWTLGG